MAAEIVNSGKNYITENIKGNLPSEITRFILANVPHADSATPVDLDEVMPTVDQIVYSEAITRKAKIGIDEVVFSQILMSDVGDFEFNWIGLATDDDTLVAVAYVPLQYKRKYLDGQIGNSLTRNIVLKFANAADTLNVQIAPETWQFDFTDLIHIEIENAIKENSKFVVLSEPTASLVVGMHHIIIASYEQTLEALEDRAMFTVEVHRSVDLQAGEVMFRAPAGEQINAKEGKYDFVRIVMTEQTFKFYRLNGEWFV